MNKKNIILFSLALVGILTFLSVLGKSKNTGNKQVLSSNQVSSSNPPPTPIVVTVPADKIEVVHFHATRQCWSCITVGEYALETIKNKFPEEYQSGKIVFRDINVDLADNREIVGKYQARGSSLFINAISNDRDSIEEDTTVWRLVNNQEKFTDYFGNKLKTLLGA